jgi:hypothetical protein
LLPEGRVYDVIGVGTPFGLVAVMPLRHVNEEHPRVSSREASSGGQLMVACRVRHAGVPAIGYGVPILPKCLEGEASFLSEVRVSDVGAVGESALVQTRV